MLYGLKRIETIIKNKQLAIDVFKLIHDKNIANIDSTLQEQLTDLIHSDYGVYLYHIPSNSIIITLGNGEEVTNTNYISTIIQFTTSGTKLNIAIGCGTLSLNESDYSYELTKYDMISAMKISIDLANVDIVEDLWDTHSTDDTCEADTYNCLKDTYGE